MLVVDPACPEADTEPFSGSEPAVPPALNVVVVLADDVALPPVYTPCVARLELVTDAGAGVGIPNSRQRASVQAIAAGRQLSFRALHPRAGARGWSGLRSPRASRKPRTIFLRMGLIGPAGNSRGEQHKHAIGRGERGKGPKNNQPGYAKLVVWASRLLDREGCEFALARGCRGGYQIGIGVHPGGMDGYRMFCGRC